MIKGGYILQPRIIQESDISVAPPYVREIWNFLLREANSSDQKYNGYVVKRGQLFRSYADIQEGTKWYIGWRKMTYNENHTKKAMKFLRDTGRIDTKKEPGGVLITICKYDYYQDPKSYDRTTDRTTDRTIAELEVNQSGTIYNKNDNNDKNDKNVNNGAVPLFPDVPSDPPKKLAKKEEKPVTLHTRIKTYWLEMELHRGWVWSASNGKQTKELIRKIELNLASKGWPTDEEAVFNFFVIMCSNLPKFFIGKELNHINSNFNEIVTKIEHGTALTKTSQQSTYDNAAAAFA